VRIAVVGSVNLDLVAYCERLPDLGETVTGAVFERHPGGKGANQAVAAARLGADVALTAAVAVDDLADEALGYMEEAGVDLSGVVWVGEGEEHTGVAVILVDADGDNQIVVAPGANGRLRPSHVSVRGANAVLCQLEIPLDTVEEAARQATGLFCLNAAPAAVVPPPVLARADLVVVNSHEREELVDEPVGLVAVTLGADGALLLESGEEVARARSPEVEAVDGTAAGDAFTACLVVSLLEGREREEALQRACAAGALAASRRGAQPSLPTAAEVDAILR
jgi:ribokinase